MINNAANQQNNQNNQPQTSRSKQIIFILVIYLLLVMSSKMGTNTQSNIEQKLITQLKTNQVPKLSLLFGLFQSGSIYVGQWQKTNTQSINQNNHEQQSTQITQTTIKSQTKTTEIIEKQPIHVMDLLDFKNNGRVKIQFTSITDKQLSFGLMMENGQYMDDGYMYSTFNFKNQDNFDIIKVKRQDSAAIVTIQGTNNKTLPTTTYKIQKIFNTIEIGVSTISRVQFQFKLQDNNSISIKGQVQAAKFNINFNIKGVQSNVFKTIIFAIIVFIVSYFSFNSVLKILRLIIQGSQSSTKYSLITVLTATLWDSVLCLVCFIQAFSNEQNLVLFILPSFMLCILFTNLQLRWMLSIFQSNNNHLDIRSIICRFNIISYGSFLLVYPILLFTNLNSWLFIVVSLIFLPQIYLNAQKGIRPDLNHPFYSKFLMFRFIIIFYVRGFPYNVFELKPNYGLCLMCLVLIAGQFALLWVQKLYGPKKVLPKFLLPPVFNYKLQEQLNIQQGQAPQCAICLNPLHIQPDLVAKDQQAKNQYDNVKLMKTPCGHKYHSKCLIQWMNIKKECPQCRTTLPPYQ